MNYARCFAQRRRSRRRQWLAKRIKLQGNACAICNGEMAPYLSGDQSDDRPSLDHVIPRSKGGPDTWANVQAVHRRCNIEKADTMPAAHEMAYAP